MALREPRWAQFITPERMRSAFMLGLDDFDSDLDANGSSSDEDDDEDEDDSDEEDYMDSDDDDIGGDGFAMSSPSFAAAQSAAAPGVTGGAVGAVYGY